MFPLDVCSLTVYHICTDVKRRVDMTLDLQKKLILETIETSLELQLRSIRQLLGKTHVPTESLRRKGTRRKSLMDLSVDLLTDEARPIHVDELVDLLRERFGRVTDRDSISSALAKKDKQRLLVKKVAPATFALRSNREDRQDD